jgi:hypothetical protein
MVIFEQTLRDLILDVGLTDRRVFLMRAPQTPAPQQLVPYIVFFPIAPLEIGATQTGPLNLIRRDYQVSFFDSQQSRALAMADTLRTSLDTLSGDYENVHIGSCFHVMQTWQWEPDTELYQVIQDYRIIFNYTATSTAVKNRSKKGATQ